jgi:RNA recognition motif-containing protein
MSSSELAPPHSLLTDPSDMTTAMPQCVCDDTASDSTPQAFRDSPQNSAQPSADGNDRGQNATNVYVGGLAECVTDAELRQRFQIFGLVVSAKVMLDIHTGRSRGIGFVKFERHDSAEAAVHALNRSFLRGQRVMVRYADARAEYRPSAKTTKAFIRNIPGDVTASQLRELLSAYGTVSQLTLHHDTAAKDAAAAPKSAARMRMAFAVFASLEEAEKAVSALHGARPFPQAPAALLAKLAESDAHRHRKRGGGQHLASEDDGATPSEISQSVTPAKDGVVAASRASSDSGTDTKSTTRSRELSKPDSPSTPADAFGPCLQAMSLPGTPQQCGFATGVWPPVMQQPSYGTPMPPMFAQPPMVQMAPWMGLSPYGATPGFAPPNTMVPINTPAMYAAPPTMVMMQTAPTMAYLPYGTTFPQGYAMAPATTWASQPGTVFQQPYAIPAWG